MLEPMNDTEIRLKFQGIEDTLQRQDDSLKRIESMGRDTNQKVGETNGKVAEVSRWRERYTGAAWAFGSCFVLIVLPLLGYALYTQTQEPERTKAAISEYFKENYSSIQVNNGK